MSISPHPVKVIAVTGGKGGVGKTNFAVNLGIALCNLGQRTLLFDADLGLANADVLLGVTAKHNIHDVLADQCSLQDVIVTSTAGLKLIPASSGTQSLTHLSYQEHAGIIGAFSEIQDQLDVLIIDTAAGISETVISFLQASREIIFVVCDEPTSITDAYALVKVLNSEYGLDKFHVVANMTRTDSEGRLLFNKLSRVTDRFLDINLFHLGDIPFDEHVRKAVQRQKAFLELYPQCKASKSVERIAQAIDQWPRPSMIHGHLEFFIERLVQSQTA